MENQTEQQFIGVNPDDVLRMVGEHSAEMRRSEKDNAALIMADLERQSSTKGQELNAALRAGDMAKASSLSREIDRIANGISSLNAYR